MEEVPRRTSLVPLAFPCFVHCLIGVETERLLDYQGREGIISIVRWNLRPVILIWLLRERFFDITHYGDVVPKSAIRQMQEAVAIARRLEDGVEYTALQALQD